MTVRAAFPPLEPDACQADRLRRADARLARTPEDVEAILEAALAREDLWRYAEAIELYDRGMSLAPEDYRMPLGRAHRLLRLRRFDEALSDLNRARELDPDGFNTAYLGALARYLLGDFEAAAGEYRRALSRAYAPGVGTGRGDPRHLGSLRTDPATRYAFTAWRYRALRRAGNDAEAAALLAEIEDGEAPEAPEPERFRGTIIRPDSNEHYYRTLLFYRGLRSEEAILDRIELGGQWPTVAYGVALWRLLAGDRERAVELYREIVAAPEWARLGHVAAEADLKRLD